ncbi:MULTISPECIES: RodZ family helix-turn-helix domain-containing protein [unclassified Oceanispirochaeta]|uniref:helix-turn-helix domain-containing protein n=1 Tax=unclassified Oceanispirochaeta TaxID=2635722 RepID=UPI000E08F0BD|nr:MULTISPECIES: helix-turn-helix domain-containing protein [unclassified Oceanispirochaeta]MBF9014174.1 helix-turn-helix domain-containing protein [Oceanispirochaeta sp. M2]NPD70664.1 helix-turn-helix domain-containing protein [Oceanispirochaeta sp. M1]RDG34426.1 helix-turn-helix domain-containing protein [Oceanispirochaeta sp. M1]
MKSIGETLREARETKGASIKQISQDSNISREYLTALEEEDFDIFPAETYLLGFLRNYSEYLGLDTEKSVALYRNYKISEEPAPLEELVGQTNHHNVPVRMVVIIIFLAILVIGGGWFGYKSFIKDRPVAEEPVPARDAVQYRLDKSEAQWNLLTDDEILISYESGELHMSVALKGNKLSIRPVGGGSELVLSAGDEKILPGGEGIPVIGFRLSSIGEGGALLTVQRTDVTVVREAVESQTEAPAALPTREGRDKILLENRIVPEDFTLNALFSGYCLFRYQADNGEVVEKFYRDGDRIRLDVSESLLLGLSSGAAVIIKISGVNVVPGKAGEVAVKFIQWVKNDEGKYNLVLFPVQ